MAKQNPRIVDMSDGGRPKAAKGKGRQARRVHVNKYARGSKGVRND